MRHQPSKQKPSYEGRVVPDPDEPIHDQGLGFDLATVVTRRRALSLFGVGVGAAFLAACGGESDSASPRTTTGTSPATTGGTGPGPTSGSTSGSTSTSPVTSACTVIPEETAGPYPGDGSNGPDVLGDSGIVRADITTSFGEASGIAEGVPFRIILDLIDADTGCVPYAGAAVYVWHCDREGRYSLYSEGVTGENYLRGVQAADADGRVTFTSIFPACYAGRWPHVHFEVYPTLDDATDVANKIATSQIAIPADICAAIYGTEDGYDASVQNFSRVSLATDNVFGDDGGVDELGTITGSVAGGDLTVRLAVGVSASTEAVLDMAVGDGTPSGAPDAPGGPGGGSGPGGGQPPSGERPDGPPPDGMPGAPPEGTIPTITSDL